VPSAASVIEAICSRTTDPARSAISLGDALGWASDSLLEGRLIA